MARRTNRQRISKPKPDPAMVKAREIGVPEAQIIKGEFEKCGVANHSDADQRHTVRSGERTTVRRKPKMDELVIRKVINQREALACQWYHDAHEARYATTGITANYGTYGGGGQRNYHHGPKSRIQQEAYEHFAYAREGINPFFLPMFERIVLYGRPLGKLGITFRTAARELLARIEDKVAL